jgi:hypothetical protein
MANQRCILRDNPETSPQARAMCNLYSITTNQAAIIALFRVINRYVGNLPPMPGVFPDYPAQGEAGPIRIYQCYFSAASAFGTD